MTTYNRAMGILIGLAIGDTLGMPIEFSIRDTYQPITDMRDGGPFNLDVGYWTDDTSMALCLADSIIKTGTLDQRDLMDRFVNWESNGYNSSTGLCFDIGNATRNALMLYRIHKDPIAGSSSPNTSGNGAIMRIGPVAMKWWDDINLAKSAAKKQTVTTHASEECIEYSDKMIKLLVTLINGGTKEDIPDYDRLIKTSRGFIESTGYVVHTFEAACWAVANTNSFEEAVLLAVNLGDDSDTVGAVTGQIAGALYGYSNIPTHWIEKLYDHERLYKLSETLYKR